MDDRLSTCVLCGQDFAKHTCKKCGASVCDRDFERKRGICGGCMQGLS